MDTATRIINMIPMRFSSEAAFERAIGINLGAVGDWRRGKNKSYSKRLPEIAKALGVTTSYLLCETNDPYPAEQRPEIEEQMRAQLHRLGAINPNGTVNVEKIDLFLRLYDAAQSIQSIVGKGERE